MPFLRTFVTHPLEDDVFPPVSSPTGMPISAKTIGEAIAMAAGRFGVRIVPHDPPKYFRVYGVPDVEGEYLLVDTHIDRDGRDICPKQG